MGVFPKYIDVQQFRCMQFRGKTMYQFLTCKQVVGKTGLSRSKIYELMAAGVFPKQISVSERRVVWVGSEVDEWMKSCVLKSRTMIPESEKS